VGSLIQLKRPKQTALTPVMEAVQVDRATIHGMGAADESH